MDLVILRSWIEAAGYDVAAEGPATLRLRSRAAADADLPPFYAQLGDNWLMLSMLPMATRRQYQGGDLPRRLLAANREMRLAKFALDKEGAVVLCAELPTESLDASEVRDAVGRVATYGRRFVAEIEHQY